MKNSENLIHSFNHTPDTEGNFNGLTKREYFAGLAMQGILSSRELQLAIYRDNETLAEAAVQYADDLLEQLEKSKP